MTIAGVLTVIFFILVAGIIMWFVNGTKIDQTFKNGIYAVLFIFALYCLWQFFAHGANALK
jgi:hypothetical protein